MPRTMLPTMPRAFFNLFALITLSTSLLALASGPAASAMAG